MTERPNITKEIIPVVSNESYEKFLVTSAETPVILIK